MVLFLLCFSEKSSDYSEFSVFLHFEQIPFPLFSVLTDRGLSCLNQVPVFSIIGGSIWVFVCYLAVVFGVFPDLLYFSFQKTRFFMSKGIITNKSYAMQVYDILKNESRDKN